VRNVYFTFLLGQDYLGIAWCPWLAGASPARAAALDDSPVALAAWFGEKLTRWSSATADGQPAFDRDVAFHAHPLLDDQDGGHFPAVAEPPLLADRLREVFRPCRGPNTDARRGRFRCRKLAMPVRHVL
jgi:hypothetical protein